MKEETPIDNNTEKQYRLSDDKRVRIVYDKTPSDPWDDPVNCSNEKAIKWWEFGEVYCLIYEKRDNENHDCWVQTDSKGNYYGIDHAINEINQAI